MFTSTIVFWIARDRNKNIISYCDIIYFKINLYVFYAELGIPKCVINSVLHTYSCKL